MSKDPVKIPSINYLPLEEIASGKKCEDNWIQGKSLMPLMKGKSIEKRKLYFFRSYEDQYAAVIEGDWKLIKYHSGLFHLFNNTNDISEKNDLIETGLEIEAPLKEAVPIY